MIGQYENEENQNKPENLKGNNFGLYVVSPQDKPILKADETPATSNTNVVTVTQAGIKYAELYNPHDTIKMTVWFGTDPAAGSQIVLNPKTGWCGAIDNKGDLRYKSSDVGGKLDYVLRG